MLAVVLVALYLTGLIAVGVVKSRRVHDETGFILAGRSLGVPVLVGTLLATWTGTGSIFGNAEEAYLRGLPALVVPLSAVLGLGVLVVLSGRVRAAGRFTLQDLIEERFGVPARVLATLTLVTAYVVIVSYQLRAGAAVLERLFEHAGLVQAGADLHVPAMLVIGVFIAVYTALAGLMSVAITDTFNGLLMLVGVIVALPLIYVAAGGIDAVRAALPEAGRSVGGHYSWFGLASILLPSFLLMIGDANLHQRFLSARSTRAARTAVLLLIPSVALIDGAILLLAMGGRALVPDLAEPGHIVLELGLTQLPPFMGALLVATILAVIVSTADSFLLSSSSSLLRDVYQRFLRPDADDAHLLRMARVLVGVLAAVAFVLALDTSGFFEIALFAYTIYGVGITPVLLAAIFWKRATPAGAVASLVASTSTAIAWKTGGGSEWAVRMLGQPESVRIDAVIPAVLVATVALVGVSLVTRPREAYPAPV